MAIMGASLNQSLRKGCWVFMLMVLNEGNHSCLDNYHFLLEFLNVFLGESPGFPSNQDVDFFIETKANIKPISKAPYHMTIFELQVQRHRYLDLGMIRTTISPWGAPMVFVNKNVGSLRSFIEYKEFNRTIVKNWYISLMMFLPYEGRYHVF